MGNQTSGGMGPWGHGGGAPSASEEDRMLHTMMTTLQMQDYLTMYNSTTEKCFKQCIFNMRTPQVVEKEEVCLNRCIEKRAQYNHRFQQRVSEESIATRERQQQEAQEKEQQSQPVEEVAGAPPKDTPATNVK